MILTATRRHSQQQGQVRKQDLAQRARHLRFGFTAAFGHFRRHACELSAEPLKATPTQPPNADRSPPADDLSLSNVPIPLLDFPASAFVP
jgi:hypothetical protein